MVNRFMTICTVILSGLLVFSPAALDREKTLGIGHCSLMGSCWHMFLKVLLLSRSVKEEARKNPSEAGSSFGSLMLMSMQQDCRWTEVPAVDEHLDLC